MAQLVKNPPAMRENWVRPLGWADPLEKGKATCSSVLAWRSPWTVYSMGSQRVGHDWVTCTFTVNSSFHICILRIVLNTFRVIIRTGKMVVGQLEFYSQCLKPHLQLPAMFLWLPPLSLPDSLVSLFLSFLFSTLFYFILFYFRMISWEQMSNTQ